MGTWKSRRNPYPWMSPPIDHPTIQNLTHLAATRKTKRNFLNNIICSHSGTKTIELN